MPRQRRTSGGTGIWFPSFFNQLIYWAVPGLCGSMQDLSAVACKLKLAACGVQFPDQEESPGPLPWERGVSAPSHQQKINFIQKKNIHWEREDPIVFGILEILMNFYSSLCTPGDRNISFRFCIQALALIWLYKAAHILFVMGLKYLATGVCISSPVMDFSWQLIPFNILNTNKGSYFVIPLITFENIALDKEEWNNALAWE